MDPVITSPTHSISIVEGILAVIMMVLGIMSGLETFVRGYRKSLPKEASPPPDTTPSAEDWETLCSRARNTLDELIAQLPPDISIEAKQVPCLFREHADKESGGYSTLGTYHNFIPGRKSDHYGPIFLYLKSIEEHCAETSKSYEEEVRYIYLHELGHHFGWDEVDLVRHGLPSGRPPGQN